LAEILIVGVDVPFENGFGVGEIPESHTRLAFWKNNANELRIVGRFNTTPFSQQTTLFTLPVAYRPSKVVIIKHSVTGSISKRADVNANGAVSISGATSSWSEINATIPLYNIG